MLANSHLTAIPRRGASAPCRWLEETHKIIGPVLDYGCGRGADATYLRECFHVTDQFDPYFFPDPPLGVFKTVLCSYVLNTLPDYHYRGEVIRRAITYLACGGTIYVTIRADKRNLNGWTKRGTWQGYAGEQLHTGDFTLIHKTGHYEIWGWTKPPIVTP